MKCLARRCEYSGRPPTHQPNHQNVTTVYGAELLLLLVTRVGGVSARCVPAILIFTVVAMPCTLQRALLALLPGAVVAAAVCPGNITFFHAGKTAGSAIEKVLNELYGCLVVGNLVGLKIQWNHTPADGVPFLDAMHATPPELKTFYADGRLSTYLNVTWSRHSSSRAAHESHERQRALLRQAAASWLPRFAIVRRRTFTVVRGPYIRVLSAYMWRVCTNAHYFRNSYRVRDLSIHFEHFITQLHQNITEGRVSWSSPLITHFQPATRYTHWEGDAFGSKWLRMETLSEDWLALQQEFWPGRMPVSLNESVLYSREKRLSKQTIETRPNGSATAGTPELCTSRALGCREDELEELLRRTAHTPATVALVGELYARDFALLPYHRFEAQHVSRLAIALPPPVSRSAWRYYRRPFAVFFPNKTQCSWTKAPLVPRVPPPRHRRRRSPKAGASRQRRTHTQAAPRHHQ